MNEGDMSLMDEGDMGFVGLGQPFQFRPWNERLAPALMPLTPSDFDVLVTTLGGQNCGSSLLYSRDA